MYSQVLESFKSDPISSKPLTEITGIGSAIARDLKTHGFSTVRVAHANSQHIKKSYEFMRRLLDKYIEEARR
ncbi:hypothetical protein B4U80_13986 [Leptotrombidium deliense]|uniref:Uncharacterized protein n=1 Tax=Leptotrombidium deliense TaxID=299467 RepID=A0A443S5R9_9ACAR|nr:hypothetical protein B4U80_13986 [Leptotrombidium deliense]